MTIIEESVKWFQNIIRFLVGAHHIFLQPQKDPQNQWLAMHLQLIAEEIEAIIQDWPEEWRLPITEDQLFVEEAP